MSDKETPTAAAEVVENKPPPELKRPWGAQAEEDKLPIGEGPWKSNVSELDIETLKIDESKNRVNEFLQESEDSTIEAVTAAATFEELNLSPELLDGLYGEMKFQKPSKIQAITLPLILTPPYKDLIARAHNGSGKTTCFALGMLSRVDPGIKAPQALCICPTREESTQTIQVVEKMGKYTGITFECAVPMDSRNGDKFNRQPVLAQVVIGTPGTIKSWMSQKKLSVQEIKVVVFDEADHMLATDGFQDDSLRIIKDIREAQRNTQVLVFSGTLDENVTVKQYKQYNAQLLLFCATLDENVEDFASEVLQYDYNQLFVNKEVLLESVEQYKVFCQDEQTKIVVIKDRILKLAKKVGLGQIIIFVKSKECASMLHKELGWEVSTIHLPLTHEHGDKMVEEFADDFTKVLISPDALPRGFDYQSVNLVINFDLPIKYDDNGHQRDLPEPDFEVYFDRVRRAGRFGRKGAVFNLIMNDTEQMLMQEIEHYFDSPVTEVPSWKSQEDIEAALKSAGLL